MNLDDIQRREAMKIGRRKAAEILTHKNGHKILLINRTMKDVVRGRDNKMITHAMEGDEACWPVESLLLSRMKHQGIHLLAIQIKTTKALYISRLSSWIDESTVFNGRRRNGSVQRLLSFSHFIAKPGTLKI